MYNEVDIEFEEATNDLERRLAIRRYYTNELPAIMDAAEKSLYLFHNPHPFDWNRIMNENEKSLWHSIGTRPMVMYPEFPVLNYFVDQGNPYLKIAIEADSEKYHDKEKDTERDRKLLEIGWKTFRVSYEENFTPFKELGEISEMILDENYNEAADELENLMLKTSEGVVDAIEFFYFMSNEERMQKMKRIPEYLDFAERTLKKHRLIDFPLPSLF